MGEGLTAAAELNLNNYRNVDKQLREATKN